MFTQHLVSIVALPVTVTLILPIMIVSGFHNELFWGLESPTTAVLLAIGLLFICAGLILLFVTISFFISMGDGTIAPWTPLNKLITTGVYAYVRNPMLTGVFLILIGESALIGSLPLTFYTLVFILINLFYIPLVEEPNLVERFGIKYLIYKKNVSRWIPHQPRKQRAS